MHLHASDRFMVGFHVAVPDAVMLCFVLMNRSLPLTPWKSGECQCEFQEVGALTGRTI